MNLPQSNEYDRGSEYIPVYKKMELSHYPTLSLIDSMRKTELLNVYIKAYNTKTQLEEFLDAAFCVT